MYSFVNKIALIELLISRIIKVLREELKTVHTKILHSFFILSFVVIVLLNEYYNEQARLKKAQILQDYHKKITNTVVNKMILLVQKSSANLYDESVTIDSNISDLEVCNNKTKCVKYSLFRLGSLLDRNIPEYIDYKVELNKKFIYSSTKIQNYQLEKVSHLNKTNQLNVSLALNEAFWNNTYSEIRRPFWIICSFIITNIFLTYYVFKTLRRKLNDKHSLYYHNKYLEKLELIKLEHDSKLTEATSILMKKIWDSNFNRQKDLELNCIFAHEANRIALLADNTLRDGDNKLSERDALPCSIVLYNEIQTEKINIAKLITILGDRFAQEDDSILIELSSNMKFVNFSSEAALCQIIYSLISYITFLLTKQGNGSIKRNIKLTIDHIEERLQLYIKYEGFPVRDEQELLRMTNIFFKTHANLFILNVEQIFSILRKNGYECNVIHSELNSIEIKQKKEVQNDCSEPNIDNVILFKPMFNQEIR